MQDLKYKFTIQRLNLLKISLGDCSYSYKKIYFFKEIFFSKTIFKIFLQN